MAARSLDVAAGDARRRGDGALHMVVSGRAAGAELDEIRQSGDRSLMYVIDAPTIAALDELEARCDAAISLDIEAA